MVEKQLRIAQLVGNAELGGVSNCVLNYFRKTDRTKFRFDFFTYGESALDDKVREMGGEVFYVPDFKNFPSACRILKKHLSGIKYDIFHSHLTALSVFPLRVAKNVGIKARICHSHSTTDSSEKTYFIKNALKNLSDKYATDLFACSEHSARWLYGERKAFILPNAIDIGRFEFNPWVREKLRTDCGIKGICMGFAGRFEFQKNLFYFLDVAKAAQSKRECTAVLVGGGSQEGNLKEYAEKNNINAIFIPGNDRIEDWYSAFDCLVMPSRYEGLPLVGVEAQASGMPCFFSDKITKEVDLGGATFLSLDSVEKWADEICNATKRLNLTENIRKNGFDIDIEVARLEKEYRRIAELRL